MKRYLLFLLLFVFTFQQFTKKLHEVLNVIEEMVLNNSSKEYKDHLGEKCLNSEFDNAYNQFIDGIRIKNSNQMSLAIITMFTELTSNCQLANTTIIIKQVGKKVSELGKDILGFLMVKGLVFIQDYIDYYHDPNQTHLQFAELIGNMIKDLINNY
jgi:hypothetical protein